MTALGSLNLEVVDVRPCPRGHQGHCRCTLASGKRRVRRAIPRRARPTAVPTSQGIWQVCQHRGLGRPGSQRDARASPPGRGIVEGNEIPYQPWALKKKQENFAGRADARPGSQVPPLRRPAHHVPAPPVPHRVARRSKVNMLLKYNHTLRHVYMNANAHPDGPIEWWMGDSRGRWDGNTLVPSRRVMLPSTLATRLRSRRTGVESTRCAAEMWRTRPCQGGRFGLDPRGLGERGGEDGERTPREGEPEVGVDPSAEQLEVVREHQEHPVPMNSPGSTARAVRAPSTPRRDLRPRAPPRRAPTTRLSGSAWPSCTFSFSSSSAASAIPMARKNASTEPTGSHLRMVHGGRDAGTHDHVGQVPERVRRVQQGPVVAPAPRRQRVLRRALSPGSAVVPARWPSEDTRSVFHRPDDDAHPERHHACPHVSQTPPPATTGPARGAERVS